MIDPVDREVYHVFSKSIAGFVIFNSDAEYGRMMQAVRYCQIEKLPIKLAMLIKNCKRTKKSVEDCILGFKGKKIVDIIAYCIMPTHFHFVLRPIKEKSISVFLNNLLNSYTRYFNLRHKRKGPLWEGRSKKVLVESDEQLLHLTRYIHLNPVTAYLADKPEHWAMSSYREYISDIGQADWICEYKDLIDIGLDKYQEFVEDRVSYQRELAKIKKLTLDGQF